MAQDEQTAHPNSSDPPPDPGGPSTSPGGTGPAGEPWDRWEEVDRVFEAALDLPPEEREGFLAKACGSDDALLHEVRRLLAVASADSGELAGPAPTLARAALEEEGAPRSFGPGQQVGRYRIVDELGRGGMATVWEAERADGAFEQRVAIKLLRPGLDTDEVVRRFLAERQILSSLEHRNIARLLDGGATTDGRPYLVMERVPGRPITEWADRRHLTVRQRLELFLQVAGAVQFAHQRLIIHRDLKPSNILVDEDGTVKLLDFGIAKLLDPTEGEGDPALTRTGVRPFTPAYASPEQVRGEPATTASDVYQLGVVLYELLTGRRPFRGRGPELEAAITSGRCPRPSETTGGSEDGAGQDDAHPSGSGESTSSARDIAAARLTTTEGLRRTLRGDLDGIVLKALRPEPDRRYGSVADLSADVQRYLARQPVMARPDTLAYRGRRFVSRHPWAAASGVVALLVSMAYVVTLERYASRLEEERDRAQTESAKAQEISDFLIGLFRANDPDATGGEPTSAQDLLERGETRADRLEDQPALHAEMVDVIGQMYTLLGDYGRAEPLFRTALAERRELHPEPHPEVAGTLDRLGDVLQRTGRYDEAEALLGEAITTARLAGDSAHLADAYNDLGHSLLAHGDYPGAEDAQRTALAIRRALYGEEHERTAFSVHNLAIVLEKEERYQEAESLYVHALEIERDVLDPDDTQIGRTLTTLGRLYATQGRLDEAEPLLREALDIIRKRLGPKHDQVGLILNELGMISTRRGNYGQAEQDFRESLEINEAALGPEHAEVAVGLNNVSYVLIEEGKLEEALPLRRRAFEIARKAIGEGHQNTGLYAHNLAYLLDRLGHEGEAETYYREAIRILEGALPEGHPTTTRPMAGLGDLLMRNGRAAEAEPILREALDRRVAAEEKPADIAEVKSLLGACLAALGRRTEAEPLLEESVTTLEDDPGPDAPLTRRARARLEAFRARPGG